MIFAALLLALIPQAAPSQATMEVTPAAGFESAGPAGGPFTPGQNVYTVKNIGLQPMAWTASSAQNWVTITPASGTLGTNRTKSVTVSVDSDANALGAGVHVATITFTNTTSGLGNTSRNASLTVSAAPALITPGGEWGGATAEPGQIGTGTAKCIARWDVVPYQSLIEADRATFTVGVVAFHIAGIEKVSFAAEGGSFVDSTEMTLNPETGVWEYCATLTLSDFTADEAIELRAIAYPKAAAPQAEGTGSYPGGGYPRLLDSLFLYVDADAAQAKIIKHCSASGGSDSTGDGSAGNPYASPWKAAQAVGTAGGGNADGGFVYMGPGTYLWNQPGGGGVPATSDRWLTFQAWPGFATKDDVQIVAGGGWPGMAIDRVRLHKMTLRTFVHGDHGGTGTALDKVWFDDVVCIGAGIGSTVHFGGWTPGFGARYWTTVSAVDDGNGVPGDVDLARNLICARNWRGFQRPKLAINCTFDTINNGGTTVHPSFISWNFAGQSASFDNAIVYGASLVNGQSLGFFYKDTGQLKNVALVNVAMSTSGPSQVGENTQVLDHLLVWNMTHINGWSWETPQAEVTNLSVRGGVFSVMGIRSGPGLGDFIDDIYIDRCHFINGSGWGSNALTGNAMLDGFIPMAGSPLLGRMPTNLVPVDIYGSLRAVPGTVGAVE